MFFFYLESEPRQQNGEECQGKQREIRIKGTLSVDALLTDHHASIF